MLASVFSCALIGLDGAVVQVQVDPITKSLPAVTLAGLPDAVVKESTERACAAIYNSGLHYPRGHLTINLAPVALAHWDDLDRLLADSRLQSEVTHAHPDCVAGCAFVNATIYHLVRGVPAQTAVAQALDDAQPPAGLRHVIEAAPARSRAELPDTGWVRHTLESAVWGLLTTDTFEEAVVQVVNLGDDADTAGAVVGALAGAACGLRAIPPAWRAAVHGEWPLRSGERWEEARLAALADRLAEGQE